MLRQYDERLKIGVIIAVSLFLAILRISGDKSENFIGFAHTWTILMISLWLIFGLKRFFFSWLSLTLVEVACFSISKLSGR